MLAVVYPQKKEIHFCDSMSSKADNGRAEHFLDYLMRWVVDEALKNNNVTVERSDWQLINRGQGIPQQKYLDCGAFVIACADALSDDLPLNESTYSSKKMSFWRLKIAIDILRGKLTYYDDAIVLD
jgi:Ulp1 family protease